MIAVGGKGVSLAEAVEASTIKYTTVRTRLDRGWKPNDAVRATLRKGAHDKGVGR